MTKPSVPRRYLFLIAGLLWSVAGSVLLGRACGWLDDLPASQVTVVLLLGAAMAALSFFTGFQTIAKKNIERINSLPESVCIFAFTAWKGYTIIAVMVTAGILLRSTAFPKHYLALLYAGMGGTLFMGSTLFFKKFLKTISGRKRT